MRIVKVQFKEIGRHNSLEKALFTYRTLLLFAFSVLRVGKCFLKWGLQIPCPVVRREGLSHFVKCVATL